MNKPTREGHVKGNLNKSPTEPRPNTPPPSQKSMSKCYICKRELEVFRLEYYDIAEHAYAHRFCKLLKSSKALVSDLEQFNSYQGGSYAKSLKDLKELLSKYAD